MVCSISNMISFFYILIISFNLYSFSLSSTLYKPEDPLWQLNETNFKDIVFGKNNTWIIEFYSSWCGHCQRFAPTYKELARDIKPWSNVIKVGAVACNDAVNVKLCRDYDVQSYPTIKLFWFNASENDMGEAIEGKRDIDSLEKAIVTFVESNLNKGVPSTWPDLTPLQANSVSQILNSKNMSNKDLHLFVEDTESLIGRQVILDLSCLYPNLEIKRVLNTNTELINDLKSGVFDGSVPVLISIPHDDGAENSRKKDTILRFPSNAKSSEIRDVVYETFTKSPRNKVVDEVTTDPSIINISADSVYMVDLENAIYYALNQEVGVTKEIKGENFSALKSFLFVLKSYFPGSKPVMAYLNKLYNWVSYKKRHISGEEFVNGLNQLRTDKEYLPEMREWIGCKGSENRYRGYPCSLWTLFHTLTVQADKENVTSGYSENDGQVIFVIRDYVKNFFTCRYCAQHFCEMAQNLEKEVNSSQSAMIWLWERHNKVNRRLAGDETEDPNRPKIQFPSSKLCSDCQSKKDAEGNIEWDRKKIIHFLHVFYGKKNIKTDNSLKIKDFAAADLNSSMVISFQNNSLSESWSFKWFTNTDISLCVSLYLISALLLILIFLIFRQRQRRRRLQFKKYFRLQP